MVKGISLANKCQLLFGFSVLVILAAALSVPWIRTHALVNAYQVQIAEQLADGWLAYRSEAGVGTLDPGPAPGSDADADADAIRIRYIGLGDAELQDDPFLQAAVDRFRADETLERFVQRGEMDGLAMQRYARPIRRSVALRIAHRGDVAPTPGRPPFDPGVADPLQGVLEVDLPVRFAESQLLTSRIYIITAWIVAGLLAILAFHLILTKLILSPVRELRETAEEVEAGVLSTRSAIRTGDEFEQLSDAFNSMLERVGKSQERLEALNESLDLKVNELAEANVGLFESNRLKSEFLANVSHELRTPLNSIIGFTELLEELARGDDGADPKRSKFLGNILTSSRRLLEMINELLDMAKIEAGRVEVAIEPTSIVDLVEGLAGIMRPQAEAKRIELALDVGEKIPLVETDPGKLQQILYNFVSNAIKFSSDESRVTIAASRIRRQDNTQGVRLSVIDAGPGIPEDVQDMIFEKFRQIDASHTRAHSGTGLGLAICRELAELLGAEVSFSSEAGRGATFWVDVPLVHQRDEPLPLMG